MEKSLSASLFPGQQLDLPLLFTCACGFSLFWASFFTMLMRNSFMDGGIEFLWYHLFLRLMLFAGLGIACVAFARKADAFSSERGRRFLKAGVYLFSIVAAISSFTAYSLGLTMPLVFDVFAWGLAGVGLACLLVLWVDLLAAYESKFASVALALATALGSMAYLVVNLLPFPFNIAALCLSPLASLALATMLEQDARTVPAAFIPLDESRARARLAPTFKGTSTAYGVVFGLGISATTQFAGSIMFYSGIACVMLAGAAAALLAVNRFSEQILQVGTLRLLFPVLIIALIPMSFLQGIPYVICNMLLVCCFTLFQVIGINFALSLATKHEASRIHLVSTSQACLYVGLSIGHLVGLAATLTGVMNYAMLSAFALGLVVLLAIFVTIAPVAALASNDQAGKAKGERGERGASEGAGDFASSLSAEGSAPAEQGRWKKRCAHVARSAGLSARETEVFFLLAKGRGIEHIQNKLCISGHTVKTHVYNIYRKMGINSREELLDAIEQDGASSSQDASETIVQNEK